MANISRPLDGLVFLPVNPADAGDNTLLAAQGANAKIRVHMLVINCNGGANTILFEQNNATAIFPQLEFGEFGGLVLPYNKRGWFQTTTANLSLTCVLTNATAVGMQIGYKLTT